MIIRRAQGATLDQVVLYFDHMFPCDRGYAYVGASRVRNATGLWYFGRMRQSDWLPAGGEIELEHTSRGVLSESDEDVQSQRTDYDSEGDVTEEEPYPESEDMDEEPLFGNVRMTEGDYEAELKALFD
jgi:hypothetical protein